MSERNDTDKPVVPPVGGISRGFGAARGAPGPSTALHTATQELLRVTTVEEALDVVAGLVSRLGARLVTGHTPPLDALPIDCSLGRAEPRYPVADNPAVQLILRQLLPPFLDDVRLAVDRLVYASGPIDPTTGLFNSDAGQRRLSRLEVGDVVVAIGLKGLDDEVAVGKRGDSSAVLTRFAGVLHEQGRSEDAFIRGEQRGEFLALMRQPDVMAPAHLVERIVGEWKKLRPYRIEIAASQVMVRTTGQDAASSALGAVRDVIAGRPSSTEASEHPAITLAGF